MSINRLRHFLAVAEAAHFGRAAERLGMAQPPLSQSIQRLERELGVRLFERTKASVKLTPSGEAFLMDAKIAVAAVNRATTRAKTAAIIRRPVRVGIVPGALWGAMLELLRIAKREMIAVDLVDATTNAHLDGLANGTLDLGFVVPPFDAPSRMQVLDIANDPVMAALPEKLPITGEGSVSLNLLAESLIMPRRQDGPVLHDSILAMFKTAGLNPNIVQISPRTLTTLALVAAGVGNGIVSAEVAANLPVRGVAFRRIDLGERVPSWPLALAYMPLSAQSEAAVLLAALRQWIARPVHMFQKASNI